MPKRTRSGRIIRRRARRGMKRSMVRRNRPIVYNFKRSFRLSQLVFNSGTTLMYGEQFDITQLPNVSEFSSLFDLYKLNAIKFELVPCQTSSDVNPSSTSIFLPNIHSCLDYTDSTAPTGINEIMQYSNAKRTKITRRHTRYFKPRANQDVNNTVISSVKPGWYGFGAPVPMYGVKWGLDQVFNVVPGQGFGIDRYVTFYFSCKNVR